MPFEPVSLSGAVSGKPIVVTATAFNATTPNGTIIHQAIASTEIWDELYLWAMNGDSNARSLSIAWGTVLGTIAGTELAVHSLVVAAQTSVMVINGARLQNGLVVGAIVPSVTTTTFKIYGIVNRITPDE